MTQNREASAWLLEVMERERLKDMAVLRMLYDKLHAIGSSVELTLLTADAVAEALQRFEALNPESFQDMPGGARLVGSVARASESAHEVRAKMEKFRMDCRLAASATRQLNLAL